MRRTSALLLAFAALVTVVGIAEHMRSRHHRAELARERLRLLAETQLAHAARSETTRQVEAERTRAAAASARPRAASSAPAPQPEGPAVSAARARPNTAPATPNPELTPLRVQVFVSEQRMQFAALLHRLGFTPAQRQMFDRIQEEFYRATLDGKLDAAGRQQAGEARASALRELFGANHDALLEANRQQAARAVVDQIVHQTFPSSGALNAAQADELTRIVAQHRLPPSGAGGPASYDWDRIISEARTILADRQMDDFTAAVSHRRASEKMTAIVAKAKDGKERRDN